MRLAASPLSWVNSDIPEWASLISLEHCLSEIALIGYEGFEFEEPFRPAQSRLRQQAEARNLTCIGAWHATYLLERGLEAERRRLADHIAFLQGVGGNIAILAECSGAIHRQRDTPLSQRPQLTEEKMDQLAAGLEQLARDALASGITPAYHPHMGTCIQSGPDIDQLMAKTAALGLLLDTGHLLCAGADLLALFNRHSARVMHIHCKGVRSALLERAQREDLPFIPAILEGLFTVPGDWSAAKENQELRLEQLLCTLTAQGYKGWIVMEAEQHPQRSDPFLCAKLGFETLTALIVKAREGVEKGEAFPLAYGNCMRELCKLI